MPGADAPAARVQKSAHGSHHGRTGITRHSRTRMVLTAYAALSPATNSSCHRRWRINGFAEPGWACENLRRLDTSNGCQDHTVLPSALASFVCTPRSLTGEPPRDHTCAPDAAASTASHPNVFDDPDTPLAGG